MDHAPAVKCAHNGARVPFVAGRLDDLEDHSAFSTPSDTNHRALGFERAFDRDVPRPGPSVQSLLRRLEPHLVMVVECSARPRAVGARDGRSRPRVKWGCMARALTNVVAFLMMVCVGVGACCVLEAEDAFERVGKRDANKGSIQTSG